MFVLWLQYYNMCDKGVASYIC